MYPPEDADSICMRSLLIIDRILPRRRITRKELLPLNIPRHHWTEYRCALLCVAYGRAKNVDYLPERQVLALSPRHIRSLSRGLVLIYRDTPFGDPEAASVSEPRDCETGDLRVLACSALLSALI